SPRTCSGAYPAAHDDRSVRSAQWVPEYVRHDEDRIGMTQATRIETDSFGPIEVPASAYWGAQTERSVHNFPFGSPERMPIGIVHALAIVKQAAARVNRHHGLAAGLAEAIEAAAASIARGEHDDQFPLVIWQTGSGT